MIEVIGDLWTYPCPTKVITTNGDVNKAGLAVMGRGVALQAAEKWPHIRKYLAQRLTEGNVVHSLGSFDVWGGSIHLISFPVKHHWHEKADLGLIQQSAVQLVKWMDIAPSLNREVVMPRPGCGNGGLSWAEVKPVIDWLDDRFLIIDLPPRRRT